MDPGVPDLLAGIIHVWGRLLASLSGRMSLKKVHVCVE